MITLKRALVLVTKKTIIITALAVLSTAICLHFGISAKFPMTLIATAIVFPIVFSIGGAYKRRENALTKYSSMKSHGRAIYFASRDWLEDTDEEVQARAKLLLGELLANCRELFANPVEDMSKYEDKVYRSFSQLSEYIKVDLRGRGLAGGEVSRCNQFLSKMMTSFEDIKHIYQYRTPRNLSAFSDFFVKVLPVLYGPYFVAIAEDYSTGLVFVMPVLFTIILVSLDNIQEQLENPFDQHGEDDIVINAEKFVQRLDLR